jgi:hypothetical protein
MLQLFLMDVVKVDRRYCICCKCFRAILQEFVQNFSSVPSLYCKRFDLDVCMFHTYVATTCSRCFICFRRILQVFYLDVAYFSMIVASVCSKCFICFRHVLQLYHLSVAKVYLNIGLLREKEKASVEAMEVWAGKLVTALHRRMHKVMSALAHTAYPHTTCCLCWPCERSWRRSLRHSAGRCRTWLWRTIGLLRATPQVTRARQCSDPLRVWRAPLICGHGRRFVTRGIGRGVVELYPDTGLGRTSRVLVIPITKCL